MNRPLTYIYHIHSNNEFVQHEEPSSELPFVRPSDTELIDDPCKVSIVADTEAQLAQAVASCRFLAEGGFS